jgi:curved DNA-binding protein CbpA
MLNVCVINAVTATTEDIKKAYRACFEFLHQYMLVLTFKTKTTGRLAIKHHPDKNPDDPLAEERFKDIAIAYQTLSDPELRKKYNEFGPKESAPEGGYVDPEEVFGAIFGGERFLPIIGQISLARDMKAALQEAEDAELEGEGAEGKKVIRDAKGREILSEEEKAKKEEKRQKIAAEVSYIRLYGTFGAAANQRRKQQFVRNECRSSWIISSGNLGYSRSRRPVLMTRMYPRAGRQYVNWRQSERIRRTYVSSMLIMALHLRELKRESYGVELLQAIGFVYVSKAKHYLATHQTFLGVGGWLHNVQGKYHVFSET